MKALARFFASSRVSRSPSTTMSSGEQQIGGRFGEGRGCLRGWRGGKQAGKASGLVHTCRAANPKSLGSVQETQFSSALERWQPREHLTSCPLAGRAGLAEDAFQDEARGVRADGAEQHRSLQRHCAAGRPGRDAVDLDHRRFAVALPL